MGFPPSGCMPPRRLPGRSRPQGPEASCRLPRKWASLPPPRTPRWGLGRRGVPKRPDKGLGKKEARARSSPFPWPRTPLSPFPFPVTQYAALPGPLRPYRHAVPGIQDRLHPPGPRPCRHSTRRLTPAGFGYLYLYSDVTYGAAGEAAAPEPRGGSGTLSPQRGCRVRGSIGAAQREVAWRFEGERRGRRIDIIGQGRKASGVPGGAAVPGGGATHIRPTGGR